MPRREPKDGRVRSIPKTCSNRKRPFDPNGSGYTIGGGVPVHQAVTRSRRHVVGVVAALAVQFEVASFIIYGRVVGHVRGTRHLKSDEIAGGGIADHRATPADNNSGEVAAVGDVAGHNPSGGNPVPADARHDIARIIEILAALATYDPRDIIRWDDKGQAKITASDDLPFASVVGIKEISFTQEGGKIRIQFHDRRAALMDLARLRGMITDKSASFHFHEDLARMSPDDQKRRVAELLEFAASIKVPGDDWVM
jgi:hypothetical protein